MFENTLLTFPHCLYLARATSEVSGNAKLNAPRYLNSLSFQMKAGVTEVCWTMSCSQKCHIMYRITIISDQNAKFSNLFEFTQCCPLWWFSWWHQCQNICQLQCYRTETNSLFSFVAKNGKLKHVYTERIECTSHMCLGLCSSGSWEHKCNDSCSRKDRKEIHERFRGYDDI